MDPVLETRRRGGIARTSTLLAAGVSRHALRSARERGDMRTVRRGWVATPDADRMHVATIRKGVLLSCVTLAKRVGLWVPDAAGIHVAAPRHSGRVDVPAGTVVHWADPLLPRDPDAIQDHLINALALIGACQPFETALVIWESAFNQGLISRASIGALPLSARARAVWERARPFADSGLETLVVERLRWLGLPMLPQAWLLGHRVDLLIGDRLVIQIDGTHHTGAQRTADIAHDAYLKLCGYHVIRLSYEQIMDRWHEAQALIMEAVAQGLHRAS